MPTQDPRLRNLGARLRDARTRRGLSQQEVADLLDVTVESISRAERGATIPTLPSLLAIVDTLETDLPSLFGPPRRTPEPRRRDIERVARLLSRLEPEVVSELGDFIHALVVRRRRPGDRTAR